jgi:hypothetical protein
MATTIVTKNSATAGSAPSAGALSQGELAVNVADKRLYTKDSGGSVVEVGTNPGGAVTFTAGSASAPAITTTGDTNTGIFFPAADTIAFAEGGAEAMRLDSSGNLGLGVAPSAWGSVFKAIDIGSSGISAAGIQIQTMSNAFWNGSNYIYKENGPAARAIVNNGSHQFEIASSSSAGNTVSFTQAMTLDNSGNLGIGTTTVRTPLDLGASKGINAVAGRPTISVYSDGTNAYGIAAGANGLHISANAPDGDGQIRFFGGTNNTTPQERMRIDGSGNLLVGATSTSPANDTFMSYSPGSGAGAFDGVMLLSHSTSNNTGSGYVNFYVNTTVAGSINQNGTNAVAYNTSSDYRLKEAIQPITGALAKVSALKPCTYKWKSDGSDGQGFIAHELAEVVPDAVTGEKDAVDEEGNPKYQGIDTSFLVATLTAAIQEQQAIITDLKARIESLENK